MDWPLGLCDADSVDPLGDCIAHDVVSRTGYTENYQVYYNAGHRWYYLSNQEATDLVLFRQTDTQIDNLQGKQRLSPSQGNLC